MQAHGTPARRMSALLAACVVAVTVSNQPDQPDQFEFPSKAVTAQQPAAPSLSSVHVQPAVQRDVDCRQCPKIHNYATGCQGTCGSTRSSVATHRGSGQPTAPGCASSNCVHCSGTVCTGSVPQDMVPPPTQPPGVLPAPMTRTIVVASRSTIRGRENTWCRLHIAMSRRCYC